MKKIVTLFFFALGLIACKHEFEDQFLNSQSNDLNINFEVSGSLIADNETYNLITVWLTAKQDTVDLSYLKSDSISFKLSPYGVFQNGMSSITLPIGADSVQVLVKSATEGLTLLEASFDGYTDQEPLTFAEFSTSVSSEGVQLFLSDTTVQADGNSTIEAVLDLPDSLGLAGQKAFFEITPVGEFHNDMDTVSAQVDANNQARVFITSDEPGLASVKASISNLEITRFVTFGSATGFNITVANSTADSVTAATIDITVKDLTNFDSNVDVTLVTDLGWFSNGTNTVTETIGPDGNMDALLFSEEAGTAHIDFTSSEGVTEEIIVSFSEAVPQYIVTSTDSTVVSAGSVVNVSALLKRYVGSISSNYTVQFNQITASGSPAGVFSDNPVSSNIDGLATTLYTVEDTAFSGNITIQAKVTLLSGDITGETIIYVP